MLKKILLGFVVLVVLVAGGLYYTWSNLDHIIKMAVEKYGTAATQTAVRLDTVKLSLADGQGSLGGLSVDNPKNFNTAVKAFYLGNIEVKVDVGSLRGTGPIIIREITIDKPQVNYEITSSGDSNLSAIQHNAESYADTMGGTAPNKSSAAAAKTPAEGGERKVIINDLYVKNGQVGISAQLIQNRNFTGELPDLHLTNIGKSSGGATMAEVAQQLLSAMTASAAKVATADIAKNLGGLKDVIPLKGAAGDSLSNVGNQVKGILGQ